MLTRSFVEFLRDERGSYTLWSLMWFLLYVAIGGLAVDITDAYRHHSLLQATADAAALAGAMSLESETQDPVDVALEYARVNMNPQHHGPVLTAADVHVGVWHFATETFYPNATGEPNAVYVTTRRDSQNDNQVVMNFLRILQGFGLRPSWNIVAEAVAVLGEGECNNKGIIAGGRLIMAAQDRFYRNICLQGVEGMSVPARNYFDTGEQQVQAGTWCDDCLGPGNRDTTIAARNNTNFAEAWGVGGFNTAVFPINASDSNLDLLINTMLELPGWEEATYSEREFEAWSYMYGADGDGGTPTHWTGSANQLPTQLQPGTIYEVTSCSGTNPISFTTDDPVENVMFVAPCRINFEANVLVRNSVIASTWEPPGGQLQRTALHFSGVADLGDEGGCGSGGVELITRHASVDFAAQGEINNVRILSGYDVHLAGNQNGEWGINIEAQNDVFMAGNSSYGLCSGEEPLGKRLKTASLVR